MHTLRKVADFFEISVDNLIDDQIDANWVRAPKLPEQYKALAGSRLRTSLAVIHWIRTHHGDAPATSLVRALQIPQAALCHPDSTVKLGLLRGLLHESKIRGVADNGIFQMGLEVMTIPENRGIFLEIAQNTRTPHELYEYFFQELIGRFEENFAYSIEDLVGNALTIRCRPYTERLLENGPQVVFDRSLSVYRWGCAAGLLRALNLPTAMVEPIKIGTPESPESYFRLSWETSRAAIQLSSRRQPS